jgi:hypothetical protein
VSHIPLPPYQHSMLTSWEDPISKAMLDCSSVSVLEMGLQFMSHIGLVGPFLPFLRSNRALRSLKLINYVNVDNPVNPDMVKEVLNAVSENRAVVELELAVKEPLESILKALEGIHVLTLENADNRTPAFSPESLNQIGLTLKRNHSLHTLRLNTDSDGGPLLQHLVAHPRLCHLQISWVYRRVIPNFQVSLASIIASSTPLQQLRFHNVTFTAENVEPIALALQANQTIGEVSLIGCSFSPQASARLTSLFQSTDADVNGIRHLSISGYHRSDTSTPTLPPFGAFLFSLLQGPLQSLRLGRFHDKKNVARFYTLWSENSHLVQLPRLTLDCSSITGVRGLASFLPSAIHLRDLKVTSIKRLNGPNGYTNTILPALKRNGSIHRIRLDLLNGKPYFEDDSPEMRWVTAFCQRNCSVPALLSKVGESHTDPTSKLLVPSLFAVARQVPRTAHNTIFTALITFEDDAVGKRCGPKRSLA